MERGPDTRPEPDLPLVVLLATGGTIAGAAVPHSGHGYRAGALPINRILEAVPGIAAIARVEAETVAAVGSQDMDESIWARLATRILLAAARPEVAGVVVTHGTDTMEETAYFLDLVLATAKPVVLVGAMRAPHASDPDGPANLLAAVAVAASPAAAGRGVLVVSAARIHRARFLAKTHTTRLDALASVGGGPVGIVAGSEMVFQASAPAPATAPAEAAPASNPPPAHPPHGLAPPTFDWAILEPSLRTQPWPRVDVVFAHVGMDGALIAASIAAGARGIVLAGVGAGNLAGPALTAAAAAARAGVAIVRSSRIGVGDVVRKGEIDDDGLGFVAARGLNPAQARVLLLLALAAGQSDPARLQALFDRA